MKRNIFIFILLFYSISDTFGQAFLFEISDKVSSCIYLYKDEKRFVIDLVYSATEDILMTEIVSYGNISIQGNKVVLQDQINNFSIILQYTDALSPTLKNKQSLFVRQGFNWMRKNYFYQVSDYPDRNRLSLVDNLVNIKELMNLRKQHINNNKNENNLFFGTYSSETNLPYLLYLNEDGTYCMVCKTIKLSVGKWEANNNILTLIDSDINARFYALIKSDNTLTSMLLPADFMKKSFIPMK